ncbi:single-stranded DNA-binding protein [Calidifontibacter sp. DB0510]|uniref:Single-stranded DNA-binding protein n=1 Tax=Metallococcus carri TaxID=1656884 RepID=A0A967B045_9MICO|nr:single-stranded DNA-binding protein [Metallococcus carri]NHN55868.1 single-stranded DNA-binding protein [Metallococcus carri]NOP38444.1 single-stranded DNA-binding protein [Calidifontibacter sp. DB2511S]
MKHEATITIVGNVVAEPESRTTRNGDPLVNFRVAVNPRYKDNRTGEWKDGTTEYYRVTAFRRLATNIDRSVRKGEQVMVVGRVETNTWTGNDGGQHSSMQIVASYVGHDLMMGTSKFTKEKAQQASGPMLETVPAGSQSGSDDDRDAPRDDRFDGVDTPPNHDPWARPAGAGDSGELEQRAG